MSSTNSEENSKINYDLSPIGVYKVHTWDHPKHGVVYILAVSIMDALAAAKKEGVLALGTYFGSQPATQELLIASGLLPQAYPCLFGGRDARDIE